MLPYAFNRAQLKMFSVTLFTEWFGILMERIPPEEEEKNCLN